ncbi:GntR family transcriptional regulator [Beduinella massiliensis]|uniref:GntR family transcriptional regulator n=1 Tax=Beduinella massiliensis TaxID=1852363 RepID=UPI000C856AE6
MRRDTRPNDLYRIILEQILQGKYKFGQTLPSARVLSETYHTGLRAVQDALRALRQGGYIQTQERRHAVVCYSSGAEKAEDREIVRLLARRQATMDAFKSAAVLMPPVWAFCTERMTHAELSELLRPIRRIDAKPYQDKILITSLVMNRILYQAGNPLLCDLYASLEVYMQVPVFPAYGTPYDGEGLCGGHEVIERLEAVRLKQPSRAGLIYEDVGKTVERYMARLAGDYPDVPENPALSYTWNPVRGRTYLYAEVARDLMRKIDGGTYPDGAFLPPEKALSRAYGVSLYTVQQALGVLRGFGMAETINGRGTRICLQRAGIARAEFSRAGYKRDVLMYLYALQFTAVVIRPAALLAFEKIDGRVAWIVEKELELPGRIPMTALLDALREATCLQTLREIWGQIQKLLLWGNCFIFLQQGDGSANALRAGCRSAAAHLRLGNGEAFAAQMEQCVLFMMQRVRAFLVDNGIDEAEAIRIPSAFS